MSNDDFDPQAVPPFPVFTLKLSEEGSTTLDGVPIEPAVDQDPVAAGVSAAARKAREHGHDAVRVLAHTPDDDRYELVIRGNGDVHDVTPQPEQPRRSRRRVLVYTAIAAVSVLGLAGGGLAAGLHFAAQDTPEPVAAPTAPPGAGTAVPAGLPEDFSPSAAWKVPVDDTETATQLSDGRLLVAADGKLHILNAATGASEWVGTGAPQSLETVHETTWQGRPVLAAATAQTLALWPLDLDDETASPVEVPLGARATVTYAGTAPVIDLGDYTILAPPAGADDDPHRVTLPPGARPTALVDNVVTSLTGDDIWQTDITTGEHTGVDLTTPDEVDGDPDTVIGIDATHALVQWPTGDSNTSRLAIIDTATGDLLTETTYSGRLDTRSEPLVDAENHSAVLGDVHLDYSPDSPAITALDRFEATAVYDTTVYGSTSEGPHTARITDDDVELTPYDTYSADDPSPALVTPAAAYVIDSQVDQTHLYRADREQKETP